MHGLPELGHHAGFLSGCGGLWHSTWRKEIERQSARGGKAELSPAQIYGHVLSLRPDDTMAEVALAVLSESQVAGGIIDWTRHPSFQGGRNEAGSVSRLGHGARCG